jgi:threonylcarbamoyladenosine tRNA methylthiotransferase MtaB
LGGSPYPPGFPMNNISQPVKRSAAVVTLGCKVNWYDSQAMAGALHAAGFEIVDEREPADVYIVNTCAVTQEAERKSRQAVRRLMRLHPDAAVIAAGCAAQKDAAGFASLAGVAGVCGSFGRGGIVDLSLKALDGTRGFVSVSPEDTRYEDFPASGQSGHTRATLKIEDGCDARCAYCVIPDLRGAPRSRPLESIKREAEALAARGFREIVLVGINLSRWGAGLPGSLMLADAVDVAAVSGVERIRLGSLEPEAVTEALIDRLAALPQFCPHFHISLQSGCAATLARMGRRYTPEQYVEKVETARRAWGDAGITTDVIVGFPGETDAEFADSAAFVAGAGFLKVHVFPYSPRPGTPAAAMPRQVPNDVKAARAAAMQAAAAPGAKAFLEGMAGKTAEVLFETAVKGKPGWMRGYARNYTDIEAPVGKEAKGKIINVKLMEARGEIIIGLPIIPVPSSF